MEKSTSPDSPFLVFTFEASTQRETSLAFSATAWRIELSHTSVEAHSCGDFLSKAQLPAITRCGDMTDDSDEKHEESRVRI